MRILQKRFFSPLECTRLHQARCTAALSEPKSFWAEPPWISAHNTYYSHQHTNQCKREWKVLFYGCCLVQALGSGYICSFPQFPLSSYPTTKSAPASFPSEGRVTAGFSPMEPCQLQILIRRLCDSTGDNICLSPSEAKMLWKEFLHGYSLKRCAIPLGHKDMVKGWDFGQVLWGAINSS